MFIENLVECVFLSREIPKPWKIDGSHKPHTCLNGKTMSVDSEVKANRTVQVVRVEDNEPSPPANGPVRMAPQVRLSERIQHPTLASSGGGGGFAVVNEGVDGEWGCPASDTECSTSVLQENNKGCQNQSVNSEDISVLVIVDSCLSYRKDIIYMGKSHVLKFLSSDCTLNSPVNRELINNNLLDAELLKKPNFPLGHVTVLAMRDKYILNVAVKNKSSDKPFLNVISGAIMRLKKPMEVLKISSIKVSKNGNDLDEISWTSIEQIIRQHFTGYGLRIYVCSGEIRFPPK